MFHLQLKTAGSNVLFAAVTELSDSVLKGAETSGFNGMVRLSCFVLFLKRKLGISSHLTIWRAYL